MCECEYDVTWPVIYGGLATGGPNSNGNYQINSPFGGPAELCVLSAFPVAAGSCTAYLSPSKALATDTSQIAATSIAGNQGTQGYYFDGSATPGVAFPAVFFPVDGSCSLVISNGGVLLTCIWRRKKSNTSNTMMRRALPGEGTTNG